MLTVALYKWRDKARDHRGYVFDPSHVFIMRNMLERHLTVPYRLKCVSDETIEGIETVPMDWRTHVPGTNYVRLMHYNGEWCRANLGERVLCLDLDMVIVGNIDHIASRTEDFVIWKNPNFPDRKSAYYQSSVQLFNAGARPQLWDDFDPKTSPAWANKHYAATEQAWISARLGMGEAVFTDADGIYGAGHLPIVDGKSVLPPDARIVGFAGKREPSQPQVQELHPFIKEHYL